MKLLYEIIKKSLITIYLKVIRYLRKNEVEKVFIFRVITLFIWINLLGIFVLAKINPLHLLSPFKLFSLPPVDSRKEITLFFPASIDDLHEKSESNEKSNIVELSQKASIDERYNSSNRDQLILQNARGILQQLAAAPESIRGVRAINDELLVKKIWVFDDKLILHLDSKILDAIPEKQRNLTVNCIRKSLQANLGAFTEVVLVKQ